MVIIEHNWMIAGPDGHYGLLQYQTGHGWLDAGTGVALGPLGFDVPLPIFALIAIAIGLVFLALLFLHAHRTPNHYASDHALTCARFSS